jgi:multicomponent Na+:H+ antiporter subunit B
VRSLILCTAARVLQPLMLLFSVFLLLRGHDEPGGGFAGGLAAAAAFALHAIAYDVASARRLLRVEPQTLIASGLLVATAGGAWAMIGGRPFMSGVWTAVEVPGVGAIDVGTPLVFDAGVYLVVVGVALLIILTLAEE